jgi:hypothetical protein
MPNASKTSLTFDTANKADPRVDSDLDGSRNAGAATYGTGAHNTGSGYGTTGSGLTGSNTGSGYGTTGSGLTGSNAGSTNPGPHSSNLGM